LAAVEQSACDLFLTIPELAWTANAPLTALDDHLASIAGGTMWVALGERDTIAGFLLAEVCGSDLHICELGVHRGHQRHGVGAKLIVAAADFARRKALGRVTLTTFRDVPWNAPYYARLGFGVIDEADFDERLRDAFAREVRIGLPVERRCAMQLLLGDLA
jgi:GNAT superfamily N-acetyltransferase